MDTTNYIPVGSQLIGEPVLACPVCGCEYIHPVELECYSPGTAHGRVVINAHGIVIDPCQGPLGRGTCIMLRFQCEESHEFVYVLQFHKGNTTVSRCMKDIRMEDWLSTIWRD